MIYLDIYSVDQLYENTVNIDKISVSENHLEHDIDFDFNFSFLCLILLNLSQKPGI